jgi:hypothetical protein
LNTHAENEQEHKNQSVVAKTSQVQRGEKCTFQLADNRPRVVAQKKLQEMAHNSPQVAQLRAFQDIALQQSQSRQTSQLKTKDEQYIEYKFSE